GSGVGTYAGSDPAGSSICSTFFLPKEISFFQIDCFFGSSTAASGAAPSLLFFFLPNEISFFQTDVGSSPGDGGAFCSFGFFLKEISFFQIDSSPTVSSRRRGGRRQAQALPRPQYRRAQRTRFAGRPGTRRARGNRRAAGDATSATGRPPASRSGVESDALGPAPSSACPFRCSSA